MNIGKVICTVLGDYMVRNVRLAAVGGILGLFLAITGCSAAQSGDGKLRGQDVRPALRNLPFRHKLWAIKPPKGDEAAFRGVSYGGGREKVTLHFSIGVGATPVSVKIPRTRLQDPVGNGEAGFAFNDDSADAKKFKTVPQWHAAMHMATEIEERLCRKANGKPCPV